jgi:hypothetical protein
VVNQALLLYGREESENLRNEILRNAPLCAARTPAGRADAGADSRQIARRLRERYSKPRKRQRRGHLDMRRTLRRNAAWGGVPFLTSWKRRHRDRPQDRRDLRCLGIGGAGVRFLPAADPQPARGGGRRALVCLLRHLIEVSDILDTKSPEEAMSEIMSKVGFGSSDYGRSLPISRRAGYAR